ncbi:hypothetical protein HY501_02780 [Candidatus Woesearchaeota archaeon]|nr:hypothetical protein [Candidatus Woesearchaeota archaeon]
MVGMFDFLHRKKADDYDFGDYSDVRSHVLSERMQPPPPPPPPEFSEKTRDVFEPFSVSRPYPEAELPSLPSMQETERSVENRSRDYDILDKLSIIESQIAAVRSQTETINERLKNLEMKLGFQRRY